MQKSKIEIIIVFFCIIAFLSMWICSCEYEGFKIFGSLNNVDEIENKNSIGEEEHIGYEESFLELKEKQENKKPLSDINIRKAIFYAINREEIVNELFGKYNEVLNSLFAKSSYFYKPSWSEYDYDLNKARDFLSNAGYDINNPLYITIGSRDNNSKYQVIEELIKEDLDKIGIKIGVFNKPPEEWYPDYVVMGNYELGLWSIENSYGSKLNCMFNSNKLPSYETDENKDCLNFYWYSNSDTDEILNKIVEEKDCDKKKDLLGQFQDILASDAVVLPLYSRLCSIAYNKKKLKKVDIDIKNNKVFYNIENWSLTDEKSESEIIIGCEGERYSPVDLFNSDCIKDLIIANLWEINETGEYEPVLVEESHVNSSYEKEDFEVRVLLKDNIFWENGEPITSRDIKYTYDTMLKDESILGISEDYSKIESIEIINEKEFNIVFKEYFEDWKELFGIVFPEGTLEGVDIYNFDINDLTASGPYKISESGDYLLLEKNESYFGELPVIDRIKILFDPDINNLIGMLKNKEIDLVNLPFDLKLMETLEEDKDIGLLIQPGDLMEHLAVSLKPIEE